MAKLEVNDLGNNCWEINGDRIYAPNENIAVERYCSQTGNEYIQEKHNERLAIKNQNIMEIS